MANPELVRGFDLNDTNTSAPTESEITDGYLNGQTVASAKHNELFKQLFAAANKNKNDGVWDWEDPTAIDATHEYNIGSMAIYNGIIYKSNIAINENEPGTDATWSEINNSLLIEHEVTGTAQTSIDISGLDINTHKSYRIEIDLTNALASTVNVSFYVNGDTLATNYYRQSDATSGATSTGVRSNDAIISSLSPSSKASIDGLITLNNSIAIGKFKGITDIDASIVSRDTVFNKTAAVANITQLTLIASTANAFEIGSKIRIYRGDV